MAGEPSFNDSILTSIKKSMGLLEQFTAFDQDVIMHINSVFMVLDQVGVGPPQGFMIEDKSTTWQEFFDKQPTKTGKIPNLAAVRTYMHLKVKMLFDPPQHGPTEDAMIKYAQELEWRLKIQAEEVDGSGT